MNSSPSQQPVLSICVPTFNRARYLECLLKDLSEQIDRLGLSYEVLVGDNCSQDDTSEVVAKFNNRLNIVYFKRSQNLGSYVNLNQLYRSAKGRFSVYLADDDLLIMDALRDIITVMEQHPNVGVTFAPWYIHDRIMCKDVTQFYSLESDTLISSGNHKDLFKLLVSRHIFPEIFVARTDLIKSLNCTDSPSAFIYFVQAALMVDRTSVLFAQRPFYRSVSNYFEGESRSQAGVEDVKIGWDRYRGGLEYILSRFVIQLSNEEIEKYRAEIDRFAAIRMSVGLRLRTIENQNWIDNYYLAARLRSTRFEEFLPAPYDHYRVNAALEYFLNLKPYLPKTTKFAYMTNDPPQVLCYALGFRQAPIHVIDEANLPNMKNTIIVTTKFESSSCGESIFINEADLINLFP